MPQSVLEPKTAMYLYHGLSMTLNKNLFTRRSRTNLLLLRLIRVIQVNAALYVDTLKRLTVTKRYICLLVKTVAINQTMIA